MYSVLRVFPPFFQIKKEKKRTTAFDHNDFSLLESEWIYICMPHLPCGCFFSALLFHISVTFEHWWIMRCSSSSFENCTVTPSLSLAVVAVFVLFSSILCPFSRYAHYRPFHSLHMFSLYMFLLIIVNGLCDSTHS